jgi:hypothetical protein
MQLVLILVTWHAPIGVEIIPGSEVSVARAIDHGDWTPKSLTLVKTQVEELNAQDSAAGNCFARVLSEETGQVNRNHTPLRKDALLELGLCCEHIRVRGGPRPSHVMTGGDDDTGESLGLDYGERRRFLCRHTCASTQTAAHRKENEPTCHVKTRLHNARRQLQAARNRRKGNHARVEGAPTDSCTP